MASQGLNLLLQRLGLRVAVAELVKDSIAPAPHRSVGGEGDVVIFRRDSNDALASKGLDLLGLPLVLLVAVAQPAKASKAPAPGVAVGGDGQAVVHSS